MDPLSKIPDGSYRNQDISDEIFQHSIDKEHDVATIKSTMKQASNQSN